MQWENSWICFAAGDCMFWGAILVTNRVFKSFILYINKSLDLSTWPPTRILDLSSRSGHLKLSATLGRQVSIEQCKRELTLADRLNRCLKSLVLT
uniref:Uncharacterized protein LOC105634886 n=1 Tax=Rhizophora mucronata TaxID=61149 RepID=A0A2P2IRL2_RHIMU